MTTTSTLFVEDLTATHQVVTKDAIPARLGGAGHRVSKTLTLVTIWLAVVVA